MKASSRTGDIMIWSGDNKHDLSELLDDPHQTGHENASDPDEISWRPN